MIRYLFVLIFCMTSLSQVHAEEYLSLKTSIDVDTTHLTLADVVDQNQTSKTLIQKYGSISIPYRGQQISSSLVLLTLSKAGADLDKIKILDPADFKIAGNPGSEFDFRLKNDLIKLICKQKKCSDRDAKELQIELLNANLDRSKLNIYHSIQNVSPFEISNANAINNLQLNFLDETGLTVGTAEIKIRAYLEKDVLVAKSDLQQGEYVNADNFEVAKVKTGLGETFFYNIDELGHSQIKMPSLLQQNMPLPRDYVERKLKMQKGDVVTLFVGNTRVSVKTMGKVKELLDNGNEVLVENIDSKKELIGKPISDNEVQIAF